MDALRQHLFLILCGVGCVGGIALGVTGWRAMPKVMAEMESAAAVYKSLDSLQSKPVNQSAIDAENERIAVIKEDFAGVLGRAKQLYSYEPLVGGVFPNGPPLTRIRFREKYAEAMPRLFASLKAGAPPSAAQIKAMQERRENERAAAALGGPDLQSGYSGGETSLRSAADVLTAAGVREDPLARAAIANARSFYCYAVNFPDERPPLTVASLSFYDAMKEAGPVEAPAPVDAWRAQVEYWIQKDIVEAVVAVNEEAAEAAKSAGGEAWVGTMAVKEVISIRFSDYVPREGELYAVAPVGGFTAALPPGTGASVFTGSTCNDSNEVIQYSVKLIMDQRDITRFVDLLCDNSFHTLVRAAYEAMPPNRDLRGKIYGSEPTVNVILDFETVMLGDVFRPLMPPEVCEQYEIPCGKAP